jgi:hypothetical protein
MQKFEVGQVWETLGMGLVKVTEVNEYGRARFNDGIWRSLLDWAGPSALTRLVLNAPGDQPADEPIPAPEVVSEMPLERRAQQSALDVQVGGSHYKDLAIQPVEYCHRNGLGFCESSVVKYVTRWKAKNGIKDLEKARHFIDLLIEMESKQ